MKLRLLFQNHLLARMTSEEAQNVAILDVHGKRMEWNGEDYVVSGSAPEAPNKDDEDRDSDQYLVCILAFSLYCNQIIPGIR